MIDYQELKSWQGAIGSFLGFIALLAGALVNFRLNRRRDRQLREEEIKSIAAALYGELLVIRRAVARLTQHYAAHYERWGTTGSSRDIDQHFIDDHRLPEPKLYSALASKVGMLPPDIVLRIALFHANANKAESGLKRMLPDPARTSTFSPLYVLPPGRDAVIEVIPALTRLAEIAGLPRTDLHLPLGSAEDIIEMEEESWRQFLAENDA